MFNNLLNIINLILLFILLNIIFTYNLYYFQLKAYYRIRYLKYYLKTKCLIYNLILFLLTILSYFILFSLNLINYFISILLIFYLGLFAYYFYQIKKPKKIKFVITSRIKRLIVLFNIFIIVCSVLTIVFVSNTYLLSLMAFVVPFMLLVIDSFDVYRYFQDIFYLIKAKTYLANNPQIIKIGITGSNGKTSVKNILYEFLKDDYKTVTTPKNFNTPKGIISTINNNSKNNVECFIFEMGARQKKDIAKLCQLTHINLGCITTVAPQHLETFKNIETVYNTKKELHDFLNTKFCCYNFNNYFTRKMYCLKKGKKFLYAVISCKKTIKKKYQITPPCSSINLSNNLKSIGVYKKGRKRTTFAKKFYLFFNIKFKIDLLANNISFCDDYTHFNIKYKNKVYIAKTSLLGEHNISNILSAMSMALYLKVDIKTILKKIETLAPTKHRLELIKTDINIIDDSYNCSIESATTALKVLSTFPNKKMVCTPGIIEGGKFQYLLNQKVACLLDNVADYIIIVGETNKECFKQNIKKCKNVYFVNTLDNAKKYFALLKKNDTLLLLNDLPDDYK